MDYIENKLETADRVKKMLVKYGNSAITIVLVILLLIVGGQYWQRHNVKIAQQAASIYENLLNSGDNQPQTAALAGQLMTEYSKTAYANMAAFLLAKQAIAQNNLTVAQQQFQWIIAHTNVAAFKAIAQINIARILVSQNQPAQAIEAIAQLNAVQVKEFMGEALLVKGDALLALKQNGSAKAAYQQAVNELDKANPLYAYAEMKLYSV